MGRSKDTTLQNQKTCMTLQMRTGFLPGRWMQSVGLWRKASFAEGATGFWMQQDESLAAILMRFMQSFVL